MSLRSKTNIAILFVLAALATMAGFSVRESRRLTDKDRRVSHTRDVIEMSESPCPTLLMRERRGGLHLGDQKDLADFNAANKLVLTDFTTLRDINGRQSFRAAGSA